MQMCKSFLNAFFVLCVFTVSVSLAAPSNEQNLLFKISSNKDKYLLSEPIWVDLYLTNLAQDTIRIWPFGLSYLTTGVYLVNSLNDTIKYSGMVDDRTGRPLGVLLKPNETYTHSIDLLEGFGERLLGWPLKWYLKPDNYSLQMVYMGGFSNKLNFKVENPTGDEKIAYEYFLNSYRYFIKLKVDSTIIELEKLITEYPHCTYADLAYYELGGTYGFKGDTEMALKYLTKMIFKYPNSRIVNKAFWGVLQQKSLTEKIRFLKQVIKERPGTSASDWAQKTLKLLEKEQNKEK